ncbi:MAG TPA: alkaline phosphatase family protein, partial [Lacunisphaera sp.]|nr:alkaline phosphatase family protein [Lacunisphaera sp.]
PDDMAGEQAEDGFSVIFPKTVNGGRPTLSAAFYSAFDCTPWNNDLVAEMALRAIDAEQLGQDEVPDLLTIGFSQTDKVGHAYGPDSHEVMDSYLRLDRTLAAFLEQLDAKVGLSRCVIVLTADHGVCPLPEVTWTQDEALVAGRFSGRELDDLVVRALDSAFGVLPESHYWVVRDNSGYHLNPAALRLKELPAARVGAVLRDALRGSPVVATAYTREQLTGSETLDEWGEMTRLSYHPDRSADVLFVEKPFHLARSVGTSHGTPHAYDTHVPQLWFGAGVKPGVDTERVAVEDIAPTLAGLLGVELPAEARGRRLF